MVAVVNSFETVVSPYQTTRPCISAGSNRYCHDADLGPRPVMQGAAVGCLCKSRNLRTCNLHATYATHPGLHLVQTDIIYFQLDHLLAQRFVYNDCTQALSYNGTP